MPNKLKRLISLLICLCFLVPSVPTKAQTPEEWVTLGKRIHGGFGSYIALGIRIGLDAMKRLDAKSRELDVTYFDGANAPCPCVADGIMIATVATPGQNSLRVIPSKSDASNFGVVVIKNKKTGELLRYVIPATARSLLNKWNQDLSDRQRYDAVMNTSSDSLFHVDSNKRIIEIPKIQYNN
ncbi:MAG: formylmethanofuran dehydrogenase subunit E family protein [Nostoc sp. DedQUE12b]|uniref:formylmethanofuran dehydrogenase subunit E family protein n=1 Tax=Nostoc sp. DedQUE12b TaxID=3075398 RepID=UPI002AD44957|nr:formylmethanofuran dehydrogenase subunit E family protein [Nostoc sp. DedQUE12b]MDZ8087073.1 formylmethanofuran dehydrogenase subunit E family protein [Nostoc sp. DedQUE12b]